MIIRYFKYLKIEDSLVRFITDDLFIEDHSNKKNKYNLWHWEQGFGLKGSVGDLSKSEVIYPQYFINNLILAFLKNIRTNEGKYSWSAKEHDKLIKQTNISSDSLMYQ